MRGDASEARTSSVMSTGVSIARAEGSMRAADPPRAAQCPRRVVRGRRCCQLESAQGRRVILDHSTVGKTHRRRPRQPRTRTGALLARATSAAVAMALLARASDGTIGLTSLGAEVRASSPSLLSPASSSRTLVSLAPRPTPSSPPEPTPQMAALDARASALDHLTQLIPLAASLDDGEEALFDHPPPRARRPTQATRHSTAIDPDPTAPPSSTPGFDRLARRVAEMTAVADELSRVEAAELAWLGVRDAVARTGARANDTNSAARRPEPDPAGDVRALAANLARVATCGGVPPGDGSSSACDGSTSERDVSALDAFRALETFAEISTRAEDATPPRRGTERRFDAKNPKGSRGSRGNARFDAKNAWFAETCGRWGVAHAAMGAALRDASPRIPTSGPAPPKTTRRDSRRRTRRTRPRGRNTRRARSTRWCRRSSVANATRRRRSFAKSDFHRRAEVVVAWIPPRRFFWRRRRRFWRHRRRRLAPLRRRLAPLRHRLGVPPSTRCIGSRS